MNRELIGKAVALLVSYREYAGDYAIPLYALDGEQT